MTDLLALSLVGRERAERIVRRSMDFRPVMGTPEPNEAHDAMSGGGRLPEPINLGDYTPPPRVEPTRYSLGYAQIEGMKIASQYVDLPGCICRRPANAEHSDYCPPAEYRLMIVGQTTMLWCRTPGSHPHSGDWYTPIDCHVRVYDVQDPRQRVYEILDPWAASELYEPPPAWEHP